MLPAHCVSLLAAVALLTVSCGDNDNTRPADPCDRSRHEATFDACRATSDQPTCEAAGGRWSVGGIFNQQLQCFCPTGLAGCPCTHFSQCLGDCVAPSVPVGTCESVTAGVCQAELPFFGCICASSGFGGGRFGGLCID